MDFGKNVIVKLICGDIYSRFATNHNNELIIETIVNRL